MADDGRRSSEHGASPLHVHQVVDEAMSYLDPPPHESLTLDSVAHAYTMLQQAAAADCCSDASCHPRLQEIASIMRQENTIDKDWILAQADLYRALLLSAFLLLELGCSSSHRASILQSSVERCLLLLQVLGLLCELPQSRHTLLQAVLEEPLVPLNKQERHYAYILQRNKNKGDDDDDGVEDETNVLSTMDKRQMAQEEQELVKLATRPIPADGGTAVVDQTVQELFSLPLVWIRDASKKTPCHVQVHSCGILIILCCDDEEPHIFYLTNLTTCVVDSQSLCIHIRNCVSQQEMQSKCLEFIVQNADSLSVGAWITFLNQVVQELKRGALLQKELQTEWKEEYEHVMAKQQKRAFSSIAFLSNLR